MRTDLITIYCRRCRAEIPDCEPGALIGCAMGCRLYTRATLTHTEQPLTRITCRGVTMGYQIFFIKGREFDQLLSEFKAAVPKATRRFVGNHWWVASRAGARLEGFLDSVGSRAYVMREKSARAASPAA